MIAVPRRSPRMVTMMVASFIGLTEAMPSRMSGSGALARAASAEIPHPEAGQRGIGKRRQEARAQQFGVEFLHPAAILVVAVFEEMPEGEAFEEHARLGG